MLYNVGIRYAIKTSIVHGFIPLLFYTSLGISLYWLSYSSELQKPQAVAFVLMFLYMQTIMKRAQRTTLVWQFASVSFIKLTEIINFTQESKNETFEKSRFHKTLEVRNLSFKFKEDDKEHLIAQLHFNIQENGIYWLKGKASSGKSTLLQLIQGLYTPTQGEILYDGVSHKQLTPFDIRRSVSTVSEELPILGGSVKKSILYNDDPRTISRALELMKHFHFKNEFTSEQIFDFKLEDNARNLSASDRMKLQFVRAFATQKKIILLDNPFQSFDEATTLLAVNFLNRIESDYIILLTAGSLPKDLKIQSILALTKQL
jgi:ABC-type bacteriocin/lantibiotic exporter with double-glycine peptidase domain